MKRILGLQKKKKKKKKMKIAISLCFSASHYGGKRALVSEITPHVHYFYFI